MSSTRSRAVLIAGFAALLWACSEAAPNYGGDRSGGATANGGSSASIGGASTGGTSSSAGSAGVPGAGGSGGISPSGGTQGGGFGGVVSGGAGGSDAGTAGAGGATPGTGGTADAGAAGSAGSSTGGSGGVPGGSGGVSGSAGVGGLSGTPARPVLSGAQAANFTILAYLARTGTVTAPTTDNWDPTAGVGNVATFTANYTVAKNGSGTHTTVQAAITAAVNAGGTTRVYIRVMPDTYREVVCVASNAPPITLYSTSADASQTTIVYNHLSGTTVNSVVNTCATPSGATYGTSGSATFAAYGANFMMKNITVSNDGDEASVGSGTQGVALSTRGDKNVFENVRFLGNQDTLFVGTNDIANIRRAYFKGATVEGDVDFIFGRGTAVFDGGTIRLATNRRTDGNVLAPSTDSRNPYGFLVIGATFTAAGGAQGGAMELGRAWDESQGDVPTYEDNVLTGIYPNGQALVRDSTLGTHVNGNAPWAAAATTTRPFSSTPTQTLPANRLYEYNNTGP